MTDKLLYDVQDHVAVITLNNPEKLNALSGEMTGAWLESLDRARLDRNVRVVVVTGAGQGFCSGMDVKRQADGSDRQLGAVEDWPHLRNGIHRVARAVFNLDKPYLAAVNGAAAGAGMDMASMADIRYASVSAKFTMSYVRMGLIPGDGGCYYLPRIVGMARALELMWTGRVFDAQHALSIGYVSEVFPDDELVPKTLEFATSLANGPAVAIQQIRRLSYLSQEVNMSTSLEMAEGFMFMVQQTEDAHEGPRSWAERREPKFLGRERPRIRL